MGFSIVWIQPNGLFEVWYRFIDLSHPPIGNTKIIERISMIRL